MNSALPNFRYNRLAYFRNMSILICFVAGLARAGQQDATTESVLNQVAESARKTAESSRHYGFYQKLVRVKLNDRGVIQEKKERTYHTIWILDQPYNELLPASYKDLTPKEKAIESKRLSDFHQALYSKTKTGGVQEELRSIQWWNLRDKYDFTLLPSAPPFAYVLSFRPKQTTLQERSRLERILNHLAGTIWVDEEFNVIKAEARLTDPVRFGLGILAKVEEAQIFYLQQRHENVWLPASLHLRWVATIALFRHECRELQLSWYDPYLQSDEYRISASLGK